MSDKMANPPIFYTVAQITFNPLMNMGDVINNIQSVWRPKFPDFRQAFINQVQFIASAGSDDSQRVDQVRMPRWHFVDISGQSGIMLAPNALVFHTTNYVTSAEFIESITGALSTLHNNIPLTYIESIGFRTLDAVIPDGERALSFFLKESLLGLHEPVRGDLKQYLSELIMQCDKIQLVSRCTFTRGLIGVPVDLFPIQLELPPKVKAIRDLHATLDNDAMYVDRFHFDLNEVTKRLKEAKRVITDAFYSAVTNEGLKYWNANNL